MKPFEYFEPKSLGEAISLLEEYGAEARLLAGGTDLLVAMKKKEVDPSYLISLQNIPRMDEIQYSEDGGLSLGAMATIAGIEKSTLIGEGLTVLAQAASQLGATQTRNLATIGGNLCNAAPSADMAPALLVLEAQAKAEGPKGERTMPLVEFFLGPGRTALGKSEILTHVIVPEPPPGARGIYVKHSPRRSMDIAVVGVAVQMVTDDSKGRCLQARIALGAVAPTPIRVPRAEALLEGQVVDQGLVKRAGEVARAASNPISDLRASAEYREEMVEVLVRRAILWVWETPAANHDEGRRL